ncbi:MAG: TetR/AcrR family transcriptional regulator C-terminal domain-containing protein [Firmicutes bacterium]|nr:TetR/AcrR family transcriptional regulator C-terminal domain-containing protein [Bacillota bacterium]
MTDSREHKRVLLAAGFKELMRQYPFQKISIKMITERAGIGRSAFYKYFADKYELLGFVAEYWIMRKVDMLLEEGMIDAGIELLFRSILNEADFFERAFAVTGQNSFEKSFGELLEKRIRRLLAEAPVMPPLPALLTLDNLARYYSFGLTQSIKAWLEHARQGEVKDLIEAYMFLNEHSLSELVWPRREQ